MSDAKCVYLLDVIHSHEGLVVDCRVQLVCDDDIRYMQIDGMDFNFDCLPRAMEAMMLGYPRSGTTTRKLTGSHFRQASRVSLQFAPSLMPLDSSRLNPQLLNLSFKRIGGAPKHNNGR